MKSGTSEKSETSDALSCLEISTRHLEQRTHVVERKSPKGSATIRGPREPGAAIFTSFFKEKRRFGPIFRRLRRANKLVHGLPELAS